MSAISWSPDGQSLRVQRRRAHDSPRADAAVLGRRRSSTRSARTSRATRCVVPAAGGTPKRARRRRRLRRRAAGSMRDAFPRRSHVARLQAPHHRSLVDIAGGEPRVLHEDVEEKFWSMTGDAGGGAQPSPDGKWIAFLSDRDGWDHLYVMPAAGGAIRCRSRQGQVRSLAAARGRPTATRIAFDANEPEHYGDSPSVCRDDRRRSGARDDRDDHERPRHQHRAAVVARRHAARLSAHRPAELRRPLVVDVRSVASEPDVPLRLSDSMPASIDRSRSSSRRSCTTPDPTASRCRRGCSCRRIWTARRSIPRSSGFTATA